MTSCGCTSNHKWLFDGMIWYQSQLLLNLTSHRDTWMFTRFNMPASWKPKAGIFMINKKDVVMVHHSKIGHQMPGRGRGFNNAKQPNTRNNPGKRIIYMQALQLIEWINGQDFRADLAANGISKR